MKSIDNEIIAVFKDIAEKLGYPADEVVLEIPRNSDHGDFSSNLAMKLAKPLKRNPREIGTELGSAYPTDSTFVSKVEIAGPGFINFTIAPAFLHKMLMEIVTGVGEVWDIQDGNGEKWHFEYVSANPTGPLNVVSARSASVGSVLVNVFRKLGYQPHSEFYVNDVGGQIRKLGESTQAWLDVFDGKTETPNIPEGGYHGGYLEEYAKTIQEHFPIITQKNHDRVEDYYQDIGRVMIASIRVRQEQTLSEFGVNFDQWVHESELASSVSYLLKGNKAYPKQTFKGERTPDLVYDELVNSGLTYSKDGAVYFKASEFGDSEDRVLKTSAGRYTYIVADIAYHLRKQKHHKYAVNLLGPDHHGHILQMKAALKALLGEKSSFFHPIIIQQVNLKRDGKPVKVSKRAGVGITLDDLIAEVGVDAARFFFLMRRTSSPLDFDLELAKRHTEENPVYYVQYAHARIRSILRHPEALKHLSRTDISFDKKPLLKAWNNEYDLSLLVEKEELNLLRIMARFPWTLRTVVRAIDPQPLTTYLIDLAKAFHHFYAHHRVIGDNKDLTVARLILCIGVVSVLKDGLELIGVQAPAQM